jgi:hypothetical protein
MSAARHSSRYYASRVAATSNSQCTTPRFIPPGILAARRRHLHPGSPVAWRSRKKDGVHARPEACSTPERLALWIWISITRGAKARQLGRLRRWMGCGPSSSGRRNDGTKRLTSPVAHGGRGRQVPVLPSLLLCCPPQIVNREKRKFSNPCLAASDATIGSRMESGALSAVKCQRQ